MMTTTTMNESAAPRRDADNTRQQLMQAARRRFAQSGYSATTVRDIAAEAGVNVALINRYFTSKEGLFEACLSRAADAFDAASGESDGGATTIDSMVAMIVRQVTGSTTSVDRLQLLLLLRSSGDDRADEIRRAILHRFAEGIATVAGWRPDDPSLDHLLLRAEIALAASMGVVLLQISTQLEPLTSASADELAAPLGEVLAALLSPAGPAIAEAGTEAEAV